MKGEKRFYKTAGYNEAMLKKAINKIMNSKTIATMIGERHNMTNFIKKAIDQKHLVKKTIQYTQDKTVKKETYYAITKSGMKYVLNTMGLDADMFAICVVMEPAEHNRKMIERYLLNATAITVCAKAGAEISKSALAITANVRNRIANTDEIEDEWIFDEFLDEEDENENEVVDKQKPTTFMEILLTDDADDEVWKSISPYAENRAEDQKDKMVLNGIYAIKKNAVKESASKNAKDFAFGRMRGVLDSQFKSVLLYVSPQFGLQWKMFNIRAETGAYRMWRNNKAIATKEALSKSGTCAAMIVDNAREFVNNYPPSCLGLYVVNRISRLRMGLQA